MSLLDIVYASAPTSEVIIPTLEISHPAFDTLWICGGFEDHTVTLEDGITEQTFIAGGIDVALPAKDATGMQTLTFAIDNITGEAQRAVDDAITMGGKISITYRTYLFSDLSAPAEPPIRMTVVGGRFDGPTLQVQAAYFDLINTAWPRKRYTAEFSPGLKYFGA